MFPNLCLMFYSFVFVGYYMYIETSLRSQNDTANLESPLINFATSGNAQGTVCVRFWYHMYGAHVDALNVFIKTGSTLPSRPIWTKKGTQGDRWRMAQIVVNRMPAFKVRLIFRVSSSSLSSLNMRYENLINTTKATKYSIFSDVYKDRHYRRAL